jgi:hypothetical protein
MTPVTLNDLISGTLGRLDDDDAEIYSRDEIGVYVKDGYDQLCRRSRCLWDMAYIENLPAVGNYSSDEEFEMMKQVPGVLLTGKRNFTREVDREFAPAGSVGPAACSTHADIPMMDLIEGVESKANPMGQLPREMVEVERATHDLVTLLGEFSYGMSREINNRYESQGGDPGWFTLDKDGIFTLRRYPTGDGEAVYGEVSGYWGLETYDSEYTGSIVGEWGGLTYDPEEFPIGGPWGAPTRRHPDTNNTRVEYIRLGRDLDAYPMEVPRGYKRYIEFWACSRALKRDGPGQDLKLAKHYSDRFEVGVARLTSRVKEAEAEYTGHIGYGPSGAVSAPLRINLPYNYGRRIRRSRRY